MHGIAAGLRDHRDLPAGPGSVFGRIAARIDPELLHVLQARLQLERRRDLSVQIARRGIDDRRRLDAIEANHVLLDGAPAEADVAERSGAAVERPRRLEIQLRHLPAVDRQIIDFPLIDVHAHARRAQIDRRRIADDADRFAVAGGLQLHVERQVLAGLEEDAGVLGGGEGAECRGDGVCRGSQVGNGKATLHVRSGDAFFTSLLVLYRQSRSGHGGPALIACSAREFRQATLRGGGHRARQHQAERQECGNGLLQIHVSLLRLIDGRDVVSRGTLTVGGTCDRDVTRMSRPC